MSMNRRTTRSSISSASRFSRAASAFETVCGEERRSGFRVQGWCTATRARPAIPGSPSWGEERKALCPFHEETKPSFKVNLGKKAFNCFGCGEHGNVLDFVAKMETCDLREAATIIADCCDIALSDRGGEKRPEAKKRAREKPADKRRRPYYLQLAEVIAC